MRTGIDTIVASVGDVAASAVVTWIVKVTLAPTTASPLVDQRHCVVATVSSGNNTPIEGVAARFTGAGVNSVDAQAVTDAGGRAPFCYTGLMAGDDRIFASVGGIASNSALVTWLVPNRPPNVSAAAPTQACVTSSTHVFEDIGILGVTDPDGDRLTITVTGITSDEATATVPGAGGEYHSPDAAGVGTSTAQIRVERSGPGDGRVYKVSFNASDGRATVSGSVAVGIRHDQNGGSCAIDSGQKYDATAVN